MAAATLTPGGTTSFEFTTTTNTIYVIGASGVFDGGIIKVAVSLPNAPTDFIDLEAFSARFTRVLQAPGTKVRFQLQNAGALGNVNAEVNS